MTRKGQKAANEWREALAVAKGPTAAPPYCQIPRANTREDAGRRCHRDQSSALVLSAGCGGSRNALADVGRGLKKQRYGSLSELVRAIDRLDMTVRRLEEAFLLERRVCSRKPTTCRPTVPAAYCQPLSLPRLLVCQSHPALIHPPSLPPVLNPNLTRLHTSSSSNSLTHTQTARPRNNQLALRPSGLCDGGALDEYPTSQSAPLALMPDQADLVSTE